MLNAKEAAERLGISRGMIYALAAPTDPIPCQRIGRTVRFEIEDIDAYKESCRHAPAKQKVAGVSTMTISYSTPGESGLVSHFRKAGIEPKMKNGGR